LTLAVALSVLLSPRAITAERIRGFSSTISGSKNKV
jgi:hypothetical protein